MPPPKDSAPKRRRSEMEKVQSELKRARQFNTDSHKEIVTLRAELKREKSRHAHASSTMDLEDELGSAREAMLRSHNEAVTLRQELSKSKEAKARLEHDAHQLQRQLLDAQHTIERLREREDARREHKQLRECLLRAFHFIHALLDGGPAAAAPHAPDGLLQQGVDVIVAYLELVSKGQQGEANLMEEINMALPPKKFPATAPGIRRLLLQYHPDKQAGAGRWFRMACEGVTKLLNSIDR